MKNLSIYINLEELITVAPALQLLNLDDDWTLDNVVDHMVFGGPMIVNAYRLARIEDNRPPRKWWNEVKREFEVFVCTNDPKYDELREKIKDKSSATTTMLLGLVSAAIGKYCDSVEMGAVTAFCAVCLFAFAKIGKEAYCNTVLNANK